MSVLRDLLVPAGRRLALLAFFLTIAAVQQASAAPAQIRLRGHIPHAVAQSRLLGRIARSETVALALALPLRDPVGLEEFLSRLYNPASPEYQRYLTPAEFAERFGPTAQSYNAVIAFARARGLTVIKTYPNRLLVDVSGTAPVVEAAFRLRLMRYQGADGFTYRAPDSDPAIPAALAGQLSAVLGLANNAVLRPHLHCLSPNLKRAANPTNVGIGSGDGGGLSPSDIKAAYNLDKTALTGAGETLGLVELDGYTPSDISTYENTYSLPHVSLQNILVGSADGSAGQDAVEVTLDIEMMTALAPGASKILVYEGLNDLKDLLDTYQQIANDNIAKEVSTSFGLPEDEVETATLNSENPIFMQMAAQGQSFYAAAGDNGAYTNGQNLSVDDPASQPFVTGVGGTKLSVTGLGGAYVSETTWGDPTEQSSKPSDTFGSGGGGGISRFWPLPSYQANLTSAANPSVSATLRNVPDVSLNSDPATGYSVYFSDPNNGTRFYVYGGTSAAAPLWAAYTALVNQQRQTYKAGNTLGFPNISLYQIGMGASYTTGFHDIADGSTNLFYAAGAGYDNATGLGTFNGAGLLALLAPSPTTTSGAIASFTLNPSPVVGGLRVTGTVTLTNPASTGGATILLTTSDSTTTTVPATATVPAGATVGTFTIMTTAVTVAKTVTITASYSGSVRAATLLVTPPPGNIAPMSLTLNPASVCGGDSSTATITLNGPAPSGGFNVALSSSDLSSTVPPSVTVPAGATTATFVVTTSVVYAQATVILNATGNNITQTATLTVQTAVLEPLSLNPARITGGRPGSGTVTLTCPAPPGGITVTLSTGNPAVAQLPASVTVPTGGTTATFSIGTTAVAASVDLTVTAVAGKVTQTGKLTVQPGGLVGLTLSPTTVIGGASATGTITIDTPAPAGGTVISLASSDPSTSVSATVLVPAGATSVAFSLGTVSVMTSAVATITATLNGATQTATLTVLPIQVTGLTLTPTQVIAGGSATGTVTINSPAPVGGVSVALSGSGAAATVPAAVFIPGGAASAVFALTGAQAGTASVSATFGGQTQTATFTVTAAPGTTFPAGLNMISVPYDYSGMSLDAVFGYAGVKLAVWQPGSGQYVVTPASPADALRPGQGYWINLPHALTLTVVGTPANPAQDFAIVLQSGWNQIGDPFSIPIKVSGLSAVSGGAATPFAQATVGLPLLLSSLVYRYAPAQGSVPGSYIWTQSSDFLQPGQGYWIYAYQTVTLLVPHPAQ